MNNIELINASAGSGKTYTLTTKIIDLIKNGTDPESMMATTFTKRAAAELRERIRFQLLKEDWSKDDNRISDGFIGTVNSICARLLKEYAIEAGISPAVEVMPDEDSESIFKISIDRVIERYAKHMEPAARRLKLTGGSAGNQQTGDWRDDVKRIVDLARCNDMSPQELKGFADASWESLKVLFKEPSLGNLDQIIQEAIETAKVQLRELNSPIGKTQNTLKTLEEYSESILGYYRTWSDWVRLTKLDAGKDGLQFVSPVIEAAGQVLGHPLFLSDVRQVIKGVFDCAADALSDYDQYKKEHGLMDFVDQETRVLKMAQTNDAFQSSMKDRIQILMVDEFQDTSPIQLALFFELAKIAISAVWVGDPKQAIYAFRGTDPQLMDDVVALFGNSQILGYSWRSKEKLLEFTNALFGQVFYETKAEKVVLKVPPQRMEQAKGGSLETWCLCVKNNDQEALALAQGVNELIARVQNIKPGDIAVLCRTNNECARIAAALEDLGVRASVGQGQLMDTRECTLAIAALRYMNDSTDTIALATIIGCISGDSNWYTNLMVEPEKTKNNWSNNEAVSVLNKARENIKNLTPLEALEQAITGIDLPNLLKSWPNPAIAMRNLDILRSACNQYINLCASRRRAATVDGYIAHIRAGGIEQAKGIGENTVNILTYHGAKGLEWPWVILTDLNKPPKSEIFGVAVEAAKNFDPARPLAGRKLRYWPWPFGTQKKFEPLDAQIDSLPIKQELQDKAEREEQRLLYVGMTRAKDGLVLALRKTTSGSLKSTWLDTIKDPDGRPILGWDDLKNEKTLRVGGLKIAAEVYEYDAQIIQAATPIEEKQTLPDFPNETLSYPPARIAPSELFLSKDDCDSDAWEIFENFNTRIGIKGTPDMDVLGNAVHAYLAVDTANLPDDRKISIASEILSNWGMQFGVEAAELAAAGNNLIRFINEHYAAHKVFREWPVSMINEKGQIVQGFIDLLLETPNGFVIIDHKDYPGENVLERMKRYIPQLKAYRAMIEKAASRRVIDTFLHLPVSGMVLRLTSLK